jgi:gliding motility-associated-like protein
VKRLLHIIFIFFHYLTFSQDIPSYVPTCGLVAWYPFSGNAIDSSGNGHDGTVYGATLTTDRSGNANSAYSFDGISNYIRIPSGTGGPGLDITGSISISAWVRSTDYTYSSAEQIFWRGDPTAAHDNYMLYIDGSQLAFRRDVGTGTTVNEIGFSSSGINSSFHHFVGTYDSASGYMSIYFDNILISQLNMPGVESYPTATFWNLVGAVDNGNWQFFYGDIDDIGVWNRALTPCEVSNLFLCRDICNCFNDSTTVTPPTCDSISLPDSIKVCMNSTFSLPATLIGTSTPTGILWMPATGLSNQNILNPSLTVGVTSGWYYITIAIENIADQQVCSAKDSVYIKVYLEDTIRNADTVNTCITSGSKLLSAPASYTSYLWNTGNTSASITVSSSGTYWVEAPGGSCKLYTDTFYTTFQPLPVISLGNDTSICSADVLDLNVQEQSFATYKWNTGETTPSISISKSGEYIVTVTEKGCSAIDSVKVTVISAPVINLGSDTMLCAGNSLVLQVNLADANYLWSTGSKNQSIDVSESGLYWVDVSNICGAAMDTIDVGYTFCNIWIPSAFTPNDDGRNDIIGVLGSLAEYKNFSFSVYNRWGQRIFYTENIYQGWDGIYNGVKQGVGTYFYMINYSFDGKKNAMKGDFQLIR